MYGGKLIAEGDTGFGFASENEGGQGLIARGIVIHAEAFRNKRGIARQTPRVSVTIKRTALAKRPMGRRGLKHLTDWNDGRPHTELNFKFYRQATNKIVGICGQAATQSIPRPVPVCLHVKRFASKGDDQRLLPSTFFTFALGSGEQQVGSVCALPGRHDPLLLLRGYRGILDQRESQTHRRKS